MGIRIGGVLAFASVLALTTSSCRTAGVSFVYMAIDAQGQQPRNVFYTDSTAIYCIADTSSARQDATIDFRVVQHNIYPWCTSPATPQGTLPKTAPPVHDTFAVGEATPGVGTETPVSLRLLPQGITITVSCNGIITQNLPTKGVACGGDIVAQGAGYCDADHINEGADSAGPGFTCCANLPNSGASTTATSSQVDAPYPAGTYTCIVSLDGVIQGSSDFSIVFPENNTPVPVPADPPVPDGVPGEPPPCPVPPPVSKVPCYNWVPQGTMCAGFDSSQKCTCSPGHTSTDSSGNTITTFTGLWECQ